MMRDVINRGELKLAGEFPLLFKLRLKILFGRKSKNSGRVLVIDTCLIGDFIATLPALRQFILETRREVDLIVSPLVKSIAESIKGVHTVYTAKSIYGRTIEKIDGQTPLPDTYDRVIVLRISPDAYTMLSQIQCSRITTYDIPLLKYIAHLMWNIFLKNEVRQWREINFEIIRIRESERKMEFDDIFDVSSAEYDRVRDLPEMTGSRKRVIIHTGSGWSVKLWDNEKWIESIIKINALGEFDFIFVGGGEPEALSFGYIQQRVNFKLHSLINRVDLKKTLLLMRLSDYFIGIDSGPRNMAHLADLRSITLLGPSPNNFMPLNKNDIVINKFTCRCKSLFYLHRVSAIQKVTSDEIVDSFKSLLRLNNVISS